MGKREGLRGMEIWSEEIEMGGGLDGLVFKVHNLLSNSKAYEKRLGSTHTHTLQAIHEL